MDILAVFPWVLAGIALLGVYRLSILYNDLKQEFIALDGRLLQMRQDGATTYDVKVVQTSVDEMRNDWRLRRLGTVLDDELPHRIKRVIEMVEADSSAGADRPGLMH